MRLESLASSSTVEQQSRQAEGPSSTTDHPPEETGPLSKDIIFELLSTERRRLVLEYLTENGGETTLGDLAEHLAAKENGIEPHHLSSKQRKRVYIALYQCHLPKLDDANVIDFESARGTVNLRPEADAVYDYLDFDPPETNGAASGQRYSILGTLRQVPAALVKWLSG